MLGKICGDVLEVLVRQCRDQMEGGRFNDPHDAFRAEPTTSVGSVSLPSMTHHNIVHHLERQTTTSPKYCTLPIKLETGWQNKIVLPRNI